jgi:hypothetical protein
MFVATSGSEVASSPDGTTWTLRTMPNGSQSATVVFTNGLFFVLGAGGSIGRLYSSPDGINWTERNAGNFGNNTLCGIAFNGTRYVVVAYGVTTYWHSTNLTSWTSSTALPSSVISSPNPIAAGGGIFVALQSNQVMTSSDGLNWTMVGTGSAATFTSIAFGAGRFVATTSGSATFTSTTGASGTWSIVGSHPSTGFATSGSPKVVFASSVFYIMSNRLYRLGSNLLVEEMQGSSSVGASQQSLCAVSDTVVRVGQTSGFTNSVVLGRYAGARTQVIASGLRQYVRIS